jgi:hypothetical protein
MYFKNQPLNADQIKLLLLTAGIIALFFGINILVRKLRAYYHSDAHAAREKERLTTLSTILKMAKLYNLTSDERDYLWEICRQFKTKNFEYIAKNDQELDDFFKKVYTHCTEHIALTDRDQCERDKALLFSIRTKIEQARINTVLISSTTILSTEQEFSYITDNEDQFTTKLLENTPEGLILEVPRDIFNQEIKPPPLSKIDLFFQSKSGMAYTFTSRVIRYQTRKLQNELVVTHTNNVQALLRREHKRIRMDAPCSFSAVQVITGGNGQKATVEYKPLEKKHSGKILNISGGGCSLQTNLPIREGQYIYLSLQLDANSEDSMVGQILHTQKPGDSKLYTLHIRFVRMAKNTRNKILSRVYDYY